MLSAHAWYRNCEDVVTGNRELVMLVDVVAREKNVPRDIVFGALEMALASATKKKYSEDIDVRVHVDRNTGAYESFRRWKVVPDDALEAPPAQIPLSEAQKRKSDIKLEDFIEEPLEPVEFGRIGAQTAKQVILQRIRDRKSTRLNSSHSQISYAVFCLKKKKKSRPRSLIGIHKHTSSFASEDMITLR